MYICPTIYLWTKCNTDHVFPHFRGQWWSVFVWSTSILNLQWVWHFVISNRYVQCTITFCGYFSIYRWNPCKSSDFFSVFSDFTSVYCEIHEILNICNFWLSSLESLCTSQWVLASGEEREGSLFCVFVFLKQLAIYLFHSFTLYIQFESSSLICFSDLEFRIYI